MTQVNESTTRVDRNYRHEYFRTDHLRADLLARSARSGILNLSSQAFKFVISTASTIVLARLLTPTDYGIIGMIAIVLNLAVMFQYLGLSGATVQWAEIDHRQVSNLFWANFGLSVLMAVGMALLSPLIGWFFQEPRVIGVTLGYALSVLITGLWIQHEALLTRQMRFSLLVPIDIASLAIGLTVAITSAWLGAGYWALVYNSLATTTSQAVLYWTACKWRPGLPTRGSGVRPLLFWGGHAAVANLITVFSRNLDSVLIGRFWGAQQLGMYTRSYQLMLLPVQQIYFPIGSVALPTLSKLTDSPEEYRRAYLGIIEKLALITMPGVALMCAISDWLILLLLGPQWSESARIFSILGISALILPVTRSCTWLLMTQSRTKELITWSTVSAVTGAVSVAVGLPWGAVGVAASYALVDLFIQSPCLLWFVGRKGPVSMFDFYRTLYPMVIAAVAVFLGTVLMRTWLLEIESTFVRIALASASGVAV